MTNQLALAQTLALARPDTQAGGYGGRYGGVLGRAITGALEEMYENYGAQPPTGNFRQAYQDVYSDYLGNIGTALRQGQPTQSFRDFLETDPWTKRYGQLPQYERGVTRSYTDPRTRFIFY